MARQPSSPFSNECDDILLPNKNDNRQWTMGEDNPGGVNKEDDIYFWEDNNYF